MRRNVFLVLAAVWLCSTSGCAAVSLFSHTHEHTHHHHYDANGTEILGRLESIERRIGNLEVGEHPVSEPAPEPFPAPFPAPVVR